MKLEGNSGSFSNEIFTGVADVKILAVNPTLEELHEIGLTYMKTEPEYLSANQETNAKRVRIDFWVKPFIDIIDAKPTKHTFFLEQGYKKSSTDKFQFINDFCTSTWAVDQDAALASINYKGEQWFKPDGARQAYIGEPIFMEFLKSFAGVQKVSFDDFTKLFNGNVSELRELLNLKKDNKVQLLFTEKGGYQSTYTGYSMRGGNTRLDYWEKHLAKQNPNINYQNDLKIKLWVNQDPYSGEVAEGSEPINWSI